MESIDKQIYTKISRFKRGKIIFPEDFILAGSQDAIRQALHRLVKKSVLTRLAPGIFLYPKLDKELGMLNPSIDEIANAIAKRDKARIVPTGIQAMNSLGLSTQVPMKIVYLTDGAPRTIKLGKRTIKFKKTTPKNLAAKSRVCELVIQALRIIGRNNVTQDQLNRINRVLANESQDALIHDSRLAPAWIGKIMLETLKSE